MVRQLVCVFFYVFILIALIGVVSAACMTDSDCLDANECTYNVCEEGVCSATPVQEESVCAGSTGVCRTGVCLRSESAFVPPRDEKNESLPFIQPACALSFVCGEWSVCSGVYDVTTVVDNTVFIIGEQKRVCVDREECVAPFTERRSCDLSVEVSISGSECGVDVYTLEGDEVARVCDTRGNLDVTLVAPSVIDAFVGEERVGYYPVKNLLLLLGLLGSCFLLLGYMYLFVYGEKF